MSKVLQEKYLLPESESKELCDFLGPMLNPYPEKRARASEMVGNPWLKDIVVRGEEEVEMVQNGEISGRQLSDQIQVEIEDVMKPALAINKSGPKKKKAPGGASTIGTPPPQVTGKGKPALPVPTSTEAGGPKGTDSSITIQDAKASSITISS
jgi:serine/threonine-protein kinase SRPK3